MLCAETQARLGGQEGLKGAGTSGEATTVVSAEPRRDEEDRRGHLK